MNITQSVHSETASVLTIDNIGIPAHDIQHDIKQSPLLANTPASSSKRLRKLSRRLAPPFRELSQTKDRIAEVDDAVAMGDEDHRVVRKLGGETLQQCGLGLGIESRTELIEKEDAARTK